MNRRFVLSIRFRQRGVQVWLRVLGIRARVGTWTYGSPFPGRPITPDNPRVRAWCAWVEFSWIKRPHMGAMIPRTFGRIN